MIQTIDLHAHSNKSDGSLTPAELVEYALTKGLAAIALTDHDTTDGIPEAMAAAFGKPIEVIPGIEFSSEYHGRDIHILGLYIDYENDYFKERLKAFVNGRLDRNLKMCEKLQQAGINITYEQLTAAYPDSVITRAHYAKYMHTHGYVGSVKEAFDRYLGDRRPCFVPRKKITPARAIEIITKAGGVPILAHPYQYQMSRQQLTQLIAELTRTGLAGIEAIYSSHKPADEQFLKGLARQFGLCISGGSDYHGSVKPKLELGTGYGRLQIPLDVLTKIQNVHRERLTHPEKYRMKKILFTDLDGTLLDSNKQISDYTREMLKNWSAAGHRLVLSSGRDINSVKAVRQELNLFYPGMFLAAYNGGQIYDCDNQETIYRIGLPLDQVAYIMETAGKHGVYCHTYTDTHIISPGECDTLSYYRRHIHTPVIFSANPADELTQPPCKCIAIELTDPERIESFRLEIEAAIGNEVTLLYSNEYYLELFPAASGKGECVRKLCELLDIPLSLSVAAGDAPNDLSMLRTAGTAIVMKNADEELKPEANIITQYDNDHDGLAKALTALI